MEQETSKKLDEILEIVTFVKDNAVTQQEFDGLRKEMSERFDHAQADLRAIRADIADIKQRLAALEKRTLEDANVASKDILELRLRVEELERKIATLEHAQQPTPA